MSSGALSHLVFELKSVGEGLFCSVLRWREVCLFSGSSAHLPVPEPANKVSAPRLEPLAIQGKGILTHPEKQQSVHNGQKDALFSKPMTEYAAQKKHFHWQAVQTNLSVSSARLRLLHYRKNHANVWAAGSVTILVITVHLFLKYWYTWMHLLYHS